MMMMMMMMMIMMMSPREHPLGVIKKLVLFPQVIEALAKTNQNEMSSIKKKPAK